MAPVARGSTHRGNFQSRGRGNGIGRGRGRGRGSIGGGQARQGVRKPTFHSARVGGLVAEQSDESQSDAEIEEEENDSEPSDLYQDDLSSEEDQDVPAVYIKPYNVLLQSLNGGSSGAPPPRKKRRLSVEGRTESVTESSNGAAPVVDEVADVDFVEESEEDGGIGLEEPEGVDVDLEDEESLDEFDVHFANPEEELLQKSVRAAEAADWENCKSAVSGSWKTIRSYLPCGLSTFKAMESGYCNIESLQLKHKLEGSAKRHLPVLENLNAVLASVIFGYQDLLFTDRSVQNAKELRVLTCLHALNHIFKTRDRVIKNNARAAKHDGSADVEWRDQGFTRPKVLVLLPTRQSCVRVIDTMMLLCEPEQQENKKRFQDSYVQTEEMFSENKPEDFRELFEGNDDDMFRLGIKFTRKTVKFFSQFYNSDIIIASPFGLKMALGGPVKKEDYDYLSSIELVIVDQTDGILMQNWQHVEDVFEHLNLQPKETHGCDFSRVRNWYLDGNAKYLRQTIILSSFNSPELNGIFGQRMHNISGKVKVNRNSYDGTMLELPLQLKQTFSRYDTTDPVDDPDFRLNYFVTAIIPSLTKSSKPSSRQSQGVLIFIPSYMDYVRVRNYLEASNTTQNVSFGAISEYTSVRDVARARSHFLSGRHSVLLYTGRAHHYRRYPIRGAKKIIMYSLPDNPIFYKEITAYLATSVSEGRVDTRDANVRIIFSKYDSIKLERIVGSKRFSMMLREKGGDTFDFM